MVVVGGSSGAIAHYHNDIARILGLTSNSYLIVKASDTSTQPSVDLLKHGKDKNYECKIQGETKTIDCEIVEVKFHQTNKTADISYLNSLSAKSDTNKSVFSTDATDKYFKLKIDKSHLGAIKITEQTPKTIDLVLKNKETADKDKKYATLTPEFQVINDVVTTKKNDLLVAVSVPKGISDGSATDQQFSEYKCVFGNDLFDTNAIKSCDIYEFSSPDVNASSQLNSVNFSTLSSSTKISALDKVVEGKLRIIKLTDTTVNNEKLNKGWKNKTINFARYSGTTKQSGKMMWNFKGVSRLYGDVENSSKGIFILEK